jgi:hypothetical protein
MATLFEWVQIISTVVGLLGGAFLYNIIMAPKLEIDFPEVSPDSKHLTVRMTNSGLAPAKNLTLTIQSSHDLFSDYSINSSDVIKSKTTIVAPVNTLKINLPRFSNGDGSLLQVYATSDSNITNTDITIYATYDQGSTIQPPKHENLLIPLSVLFIVISIIVFVYATWNRQQREKLRYSAARVAFDLVHLYYVLNNDRDSNKIDTSEMDGYKRWKGGKLDLRENDFRTVSKLYECLEK